MAETGLVVVSFLSARIDRVHRNRTKKEGGGREEAKNKHRHILSNETSDQSASFPLHCGSHRIPL